MSALGRSTGLSHPGRRRRRNEDAWVCHPPLFAVADGMGGARGGEIASRVAATALGESVDGSGEARVVALIQEANRQVYDRAREDSDAAGMGTTITVALFEDGIVSIGHVGDSRAYLIRDRKVDQLTEDHSLVAELVRTGRLSPEEAESHPQRSVITRALGTDPDVDVDSFSVAAKPGDLFLICSDGLTSMLDDEAIFDVVEHNREDLDSSAKELIAAANRNGGEDNITVVFFEVVEEGAQAPSETKPMPALDGEPAGARGRRGHADRGRQGAGHRHDGRSARAGPRDGPGAPGRAARAEASPRRPGGSHGDRARRGRRAPPARDLAARPEPVMFTLSYRNRELVNLFVVALLTTFGFASVYIARQDVVSTGSLSYALFFFALYLTAHVVARITVPQADPYLLPMAGLLTAVGVTEIYRLNPDNAFRQGLWIVVGVAAFSATLLLLRHDYRRLESYKYLFGLTAIGLLVLPALPVIGQTVNGARLWVQVGGIRFQPGELAKIMLIIFLAGYLREKREVLAQGRIKDFGPLLAIWGAAMLVLVETNDLGSGLLYFGIFLAMLYVATARGWYALGGLVLFIAGAAVIYKAVPRVEQRVTVWLDPWPHAHDTGYQIVQSSYSIANGGFAGKGFGKGVFATTDGHTLIPFLPTDFIYSAIAQELGLVGAAAILLVYMVFCLRGFRIAMLAQDGFSKLLAVGLTFGFALQTFIIVGGVLRIIPLTGITLPFISYGGSSVVANFVLLAGLLLVSHRANSANQIGMGGRT